MDGVTDETVVITASQIHDKIDLVIVDKGDIVGLVLVTVLCEEHVLIEDVPGTGKTMLARSVARSLGCTFRRIQCTPDPLPSDITGTYTYNQKTGDFQFRPGPVLPR